MCGFCSMCVCICVGVTVICVLVFTVLFIVSFMYIPICPYCKYYCHRVQTQLQEIIILQCTHTAAVWWCYDCLYSMLSCFFGLSAHVTDYAFSFRLLSHQWSRGVTYIKLHCVQCMCVCVYTYTYRCRVSFVNVHCFKSIVFHVVDALAIIFLSASTLRHNIFVSATKEP